MHKKKRETANDLFCLPLLKWTLWFIHLRFLPLWEFVIHKGCLCFSRRFYPLSKLRSIVYDLPSLELYSPFEGFLLQVEYSHLAAFSHPRGITIYGCLAFTGLIRPLGSHPHRFEFSHRKYPLWSIVRISDYSNTGVFVIRIRTHSSYTL